VEALRLTVRIGPGQGSGAATWGGALMVGGRVGVWALLRMLAILAGAGLCRGPAYAHAKAFIRPRFNLRAARPLASSAARSAFPNTLEGKAAAQALLVSRI
jgi:hypothetical protein